MLLLSGKGTLALTLPSTGRDVPSAKLARTYSQPCDVSLEKSCAAIANGPSAEPTAAQLTQSQQPR